MKKLLAILLMAIMMIPFACAAEYEGDEFLSEADMAEFEIWDGDDIIGFMPGDEGGYTGEWMPLEELNMEFCLPDGWQLAVTEEEKVVFYAEKEDASVSLAICIESNAVQDIFLWGDRNLESYEIDTASFYDVIIKEIDNQTTVYLINAENKLLGFRFNYEDIEAISREMILEIVGTAYEIWA